MAKSKCDTRKAYKYKNEYCEMLVKHMEEGLSFESFAGVIHVDRATIYRWKDDHYDFKAAFEEGWARCFSFWEKVGRSGTLGKIKNFNTACWIFNMKNRFGWRDKNDIVLSGNENPIKIVIDKEDEKL